MEAAWRAHRARLRAFLRARVAPGEVEDLLQEVGLRATAGLDRLEDPSKAGAWLYRIARRVVADHYRARSRAAVDPDDLWYGAVETTARERLEHCVAPMIEALPAEAAALLRAVDREGRPQKDIAARHGLAYSTLKSRVQAARTALRARFEACCAITRDTRGGLAAVEPRRPCDLC
ncbi:MAG: sigma factor [Pseudomonadota bacterium]